ncbi:phosphotransferase enzyme family protein [Paracoccus sp. (in: a-proteobacteria)]|uniref:phosphotransferase enzyme family protein n=1 Tax=Paracoccus sp. TaxID=267 RepID=UPI003A8C7B1A
MSDPTGQALALWGLQGADCAFVAGRENRVYRVRGPQGDFALRFKRPGYRSDAELLSELQWMAALKQAGLNVPGPLPSRRGALLEVIGDQRVDLLGWMRGQPMGHARQPLQLDEAPSLFHRLGQQMARLHAASDEWTRPVGFRRCDWNPDGLLGEAPLWGRFWENPTLDAATRDLLERFRKTAAQELAQELAGLDHGLIHADLVRENVLIDGGDMALIDLDDGGWGFRLFDLATVIFNNRDEAGHDRLQAALIAGYRSLRPIDTSLLDLFVALRAVTYVGWIVPRMAEDGAAARNRRFVDAARDCCARYLGG